MKLLNEELRGGRVDEDVARRLGVRLAGVVAALGGAGIEMIAISGLAEEIRGDVERECRVALIDPDLPGTHPQARFIPDSQSGSTYPLLGGTDVVISRFVKRLAEVQPDYRIRMPSTWLSTYRNRQLLDKLTELAKRR